MVIRLHEIDESQLGQGQFAGFRMTAEEFYELPDDGCRYELINGVVVMSPSPTPAHQKVAGEVFTQLHLFLRGAPIGHVFYEMDVLLNPGVRGEADLVCKPDVSFVRSDRPISSDQRLSLSPDLAVEVVSRGTRKRDTIQKRADYERFGVRGYWIVDPERDSVTFLRLIDGKFAEVDCPGDGYASEAVPGFVLDLRPVRAAFKPW
ncbi:MAG: hypothetical protein AMXMBFR47_32900 [Planctomycetota bacterium]